MKVFKSLAIYLMTLCIVMIGVMMTPIQAASSNEKAIFSYLKNNMGLNTAAACGVLANIRCESGFRTGAIGDHGTSYGICQWHKGRYTRLKKYCAGQDLDYQSLDGQLAYLKYELKNYYKKVYNCLNSVDNDADGAYKAGYNWCCYFEAPRARSTSSVKRGNLAKNTYWPNYKNATVTSTKKVSEKTTTTVTKTKASPAKESESYKKGTYKLTANVPVRKAASATSKQLGKLSKGTKVYVSTIKDVKWAKISYNGSKAYISLKNTTYVSAKKTGETSFTKTSLKKTETKGDQKADQKAAYKKGTYQLTQNMSLRKTAEKTGKYLALVKKGTKIKVKTVTNKKWAKITYKGKKGYISLKYAKKI